MPKVTVPQAVFNKAMEETYEFDKLEQICFDFGMEIEQETEVDEVTKVETETFIFETAANRPDLLCAEGIINSLRVYLQKSKTPVYTLTNPEQRQQIIVKSSISELRPFVVGCILRDISFTEESYQSFIDLQTKLHFNHCRRRRLVAIGTHDLDTISGPFVYEGRAPADIKFNPLNSFKIIQNLKLAQDPKWKPILDSKSELNGEQMIELYEQDGNYKEFIPIIKESPVYPVITDSKNVVLSVPPIINGEHSKMSKNTKNIFIECTATDHTRAIQTLNVMIASFSQYCAKKFTVEQVDIVYESKTEVTPDLSEKEFTVSVDKVRRLGTFETDQQQVIQLLNKMQFRAEGVESNKDQVKVFVPAFRSDILQECDLAEDVCIAYGYNNIKKVLPTSFTVGQQQILNKLSDLIREEVCAAGYQEGLNFALNNEDDLTKKLNKLQDLDMVKIQNPRTEDYTCGRTTLIPGILKWLGHNKVNKLPLKLFELSDVILKDDSKAVGARNERRIAALYYNTSAQLEIIHGLVDTIFTKLNIEHVGVHKDEIKVEDDEGNVHYEIRERVVTKEQGYVLEASNSPTFFPQRSARIMFQNQEIGVMGILHPEVLSKYLLPNPVSLFEINLEPLFRHFTK